MRDDRQTKLVLELGVDAAEQIGDAGAHRLVSKENNHCHRREDQRILGHRLRALILVNFHERLSQQVHFPDLLIPRSLIGGWRTVSPPPRTSLRLQLGVDAAEQRGDLAAHRLVAQKHYHRDRRQNQSILSHRLSAPILTEFHNQFRKSFHFTRPPWLNWQNSHCPRYLSALSIPASPRGLGENSSYLS